MRIFKPNNAVVRFSCDSCGLTIERPGKMTDEDRSIPPAWSEHTVRTSIPGPADDEDAGHTDAYFFHLCDKCNNSFFESLKCLK